MADTCPYCHADFTGEPIPQEYIDKGYYGVGHTHYSRKIGLYDVQRDMTTQWQCPDCKKVWDRFK